MKSMIAAIAISIGCIGVAQASPALGIDETLATADQIPVTDVAWVGRYGQLCFHGPVWIPACHATNEPVGYMRGHWNPTGTRFIPGRYY